MAERGRIWLGLVFVGATACASSPAILDETDEGADAGTESSTTAAVFQGHVRCAEGGCHTGTATAAAHVALFAVPAHAKEPCTECHHGNGSARLKKQAHAEGGLKEMLRADLLGAACVHCHVPGGVAGTELVAEGTKIFLAEGCAFCHPGQVKTVGHAPFAPTLFGVGARGTKFLEKVLRDPGSVNKGTVMPSAAHLFDHHPERGRALVAYLMSLRGKAARKLAHDPSARCASCHGATPARSEAYAAHRCVVLTAEKTAFACARCHAGGVPSSEGECLYVTERARECGVCHEGGLHGR